MSAVLDETKEYEHSIDPARVRNELVRYLTTACNYVRRQGLTDEDITATVKSALAAQAAARAPITLPKLELRDKGINDMRINQDAIDA